MAAPWLAAIFVYPVKSLTPVPAASVESAPGGSLVNDRRWAMVDAEGSLINGKRTADIGAYQYEWDGVSVPVVSPATSLIEDAIHGFPDDVDSPGPTVVSRATLAEVAGWFDGLDADAVCARLRPNLILDGVPAFWEDRLFGEPGVRVPFDIGPVRLEGVNPCARCVVPSRDPVTGAAIPGFQKRFAAMRQDTLPPWARRDRFDHFYRVTVNTVIPPEESGKLLSVGDAVRLA